MTTECTCPRCGRSFVVPSGPRGGRPRRWCSGECRRLASEERRAAARERRAVTFISPEITLDEHVDAVLDSPAACKRVLRQIAQWHDADALADAKWDSVTNELARLRRPAQQTRRL